LKPTVIITPLGSNQGFGGTEQDIVTATAISPSVTSTVLLTACGIWSSDQTNNAATWRIKEGSTELAIATSWTGTSGQTSPITLQVKITGVTAGSHTYKLTAVRAAGAGTHTASAGAGTSLRVEYFAQ
jgi:hypothetical protein